MRRNMPPFNGNGEWDWQTGADDGEISHMNDLTHQIRDLKTILHMISIDYSYPKTLQEAYMQRDALIGKLVMTRMAIIQINKMVTINHPFVLLIYDQVVLNSKFNEKIKRLKISFEQKNLAIEEVFPNTSIDKTISIHTGKIHSLVDTILVNGEGIFAQLI